MCNRLFETDIKWSAKLTSLALKNGVKNVQTAGYNGAHTVCASLILAMKSKTRSKFQKIGQIQLFFAFV